MMEDPPLTRCWCSPELAEEFPQLVLTATEVPGSNRRSPREVKHRLRAMSDRFRGARAVTMRQESVPWAYRVFFRHVGIDPDERRTPIEAIALERLQHGGFESRGLVNDALLIATFETGVPVYAFDRAALDGPIGLRLTVDGERLGGDEAGRTVAGGQLAMADSAAALAILFGDAAERVLPTRATEQLTLTAVGVKGVPALSVEEALWTAAEVLAQGN
jgi:DNA/RNA-binding domain of Phe-tRNA-synthetase-like protein